MSKLSPQVVAEEIAPRSVERPAESDGLIFDDNTHDWSMPNGCAGCTPCGTTAHSQM